MSNVTPALRRDPRSVAMNCNPSRLRRIPEPGGTPPARLVPILPVAVVPMALPFSEPLGDGLALDTSTLGTGVVVLLALGVVGVLLRVFGDELARRSRPRVYSVRPAGDPRDDDQSAVWTVVLLILGLLAAAAVLGIRF